MRFRLSFRIACLMEAHESETCHMFSLKNTYVTTSRHLQLNKFDGHATIAYFYDLIKYTTYLKYLFRSS